MDAVEVRQLFEYVSFIKKREASAAKVRLKANKKRFKQQLKDFPLGIKIAIWINYNIIQQMYKVTAYSVPTQVNGIRVRKEVYIRARNADEAIIKFHKQNKKDTLGKVEAVKNQIFVF